MIEITTQIKERAMLVALKTSSLTKYMVEEHLDELEELADTAGAETIFKIIQAKSAFDPAFYLGRGKAEELAELVETNNINLVIFDDELDGYTTRQAKFSQKKQNHSRA